MNVETSGMPRFVTLKIKWTLVVWLTFALSGTAALCAPDYIPLEQSTVSVYVVKPGDTLSQILFALNIGPLYGRRGAVIKITRLNAQVNTGHVQKNGDFIRPGSLIYLRTTPSTDGRTPATQEIFVAAPSPTPIPTALVAVPALPPPPPPTATPQVATPTPLPPAVATPTPSPLSAAATPPALRATPPPAEDLFSDLALGASADYFVLQGYQPSNRTSARLLSGLTPALSADWKQHWSESLFTHLFLDWDQATIKPAEPGVSLTGSSFSRTGFGFGVGALLGSKALLAFDASMAQELFYHATSPTSLQLDQVPLVHLHARAEATVLDRKPFRLNVNAGAGTISGGSYMGYTIKSGFDYEFGLQIVQTFKAATFGCGPEFVTRQQDTNIVNLRERSVGIYCLFSHELRSAIP